MGLRGASASGSKRLTEVLAPAEPDPASRRIDRSISETDNRTTTRGPVFNRQNWSCFRLALTLDVFNFELSGEEIALIASMDTNTSLFFDHSEPQMVSFLGQRRAD